MFHFLAKLGRKPWASGLTGGILTLVPMSYWGFQIYGHSVVRNIFIADDGHGRKADISDDLKSLIVTVSNDIKDTFNKSLLPKVFTTGPFAPAPSPIKWFASCTLMPISFGSTSFRSGVIIGLPNYFNFDNTRDLPDSLFFVTKVSLFKEDTKKDQDETNKSPDEADPIVSHEAQPGVVLGLNRNDPQVQQYAESLILSERAKKFVIARELFMANSFRMFNILGAIALSTAFSFAIGRSGVKYLKLADAHVSHRMTIYAMGGMIAYVNYMLLSDTINREYLLDCDKKAAKVNEEYYEGAIEYFKKTIERNKALRNLMAEFESVFDERGNVKQPIIRQKHVPLDERLKIIKREKTSSQV